MFQDDQYQWTLHGRSIAVKINRLNESTTECMKIKRDTTQFEFEIMRPSQTATITNNDEKDIYVQSLTDMIRKT